MFDMQEYVDVECTYCNKLGKDPRKRTRKCPKCNGRGTMRICKICKSVICKCHPNIMY
jgi:RecJ-like exonuclease